MLSGYGINICVHTCNKKDTDSKVDPRYDILKNIGHALGSKRIVAFDRTEL